MAAYVITSAVSLVIIIMCMATSSEAVEYQGEPDLTAYDVSGHVDKSVTLRCQLLTGKHNRGWFKIMWSRVEPDASVLPLIHLQARLKIPQWNAKIPPSLQPRVQPIITIQPGLVEFNLVINNLTCADEGEYRCSALVLQDEIMSAAELNIYADPQTPEIIHEFFPSSQPQRIEARCRADVGIPPRMLVWYMKGPGASYFMMIDKQHDIVQETDGCHIVSTRTYIIILSEEMRGAQFRCGYPGFIEKESMYDELDVDKDIQGVEEVRLDEKLASTCESEGCDLGNNKNDLIAGHTHGNQASHTSTDSLLLCLAAFHFYQSRLCV